MGTESNFAALSDFVRPMIGLTAWGVRQGYSSFLTFEFGEPSLHVHEYRTKEGVRRSAHVRGAWHLWIYCCSWRAWQRGEQIAWSEEPDDVVGRAAATMNGQKLVAVNVDPARGRSTFTFDLGASLDTWPHGSDGGDHQWMVSGRGEVFVYRADGLYARHPIDANPRADQWLPLR